MNKTPIKISSPGQSATEGVTISEQESLPSISPSGASLILMPCTSDPIVEENKIRKYLLSTTHPDGKGKAAFFLPHGFSTEKWEEFAEALSQHGKNNYVESEEQSQYGTKYMVVCRIKTPDGKNPCIITVWIVEGQKPPKLVTSYPKSPEDTHCDEG